jgi:hypothetical protein
MILEDNELVLTRTYRKVLIGRLRTTNYNFNNYIQRLKKKKVLVTDGDYLKVNDKLVNTLISESISFKFNVTEV